MSYNFAKRLWQSNSVRRSNRRPRAMRLSLEHLEDRLVPSANSFEPWQIQQAYGFNQISFNNGTVKGDGTGQTIAIVDAYSDPNITQDVDKFDQRYGLGGSASGPNGFLSVQPYSSGTLPPQSPPPSNAELTKWGLEERMDVEWAHAMAPGAKIVLVEADQPGDLFSAAQFAAGLEVGQQKVSVVSMSFGGSSPGESGADLDFSYPGVTFVASAGDNGEFGYPAASPNVLAVGGTALTLDSSGNYSGETVWNDSSYESPPPYGYTEPVWKYVANKGDVLQNAPTAPAWGESGGGPNPYYAPPNYPNGKLGPDVAYNADPFTGYYVYDSYDPDRGQPDDPLKNLYVNPSDPNYPDLLWGQGGTSAAAPQWAALIAIADQGRYELYGPGSSLSGSQTLNMIRNPSMENYDFHHTNITGSIEYQWWNASLSQYVNEVYSGSQVYGQGTPIANVLVQDLVYGQAPSTPMILSATAGSPSKIHVTWSSVTDAQSYTLEWGTDGSTFPNEVNLPAGQLSYDVTSGLQPSTPYYFRVLASNGLGSSAPSASKSAITLIALTATPVSSSQINLSWTPESGATEYLIYSSSNGGTQPIYIAPAGVTSYKVYGLASGATYYFQVVTVDDYSPTASALTFPAAPALTAKTGSTASDLSHGQITLNWTSVTGASYYTLQRLDNGIWDTIATPIYGTSYTDSLIPTDTPYSYRVLAGNSSGVSPFSDPKSAVSSLTSSEQFVQTAYLDFLSRTGAKAELDGWVNAVPPPGQTWQQYVASSIAHSDEALGEFVTYNPDGTIKTITVNPNGVVPRMYEEFLGRPADLPGDEHWVSYLQHGGTEEQVMAAMLGSTELFSDLNDNDTTFVTYLYNVVMHRTPSGVGPNHVSPQEIQGWVNYMQNGGTPAQVATDFVYSSEFRTKSIEALYGADPNGNPVSYSFIPDLLHRAADQGGLNYWFNSGLDLLSMEIDFVVITA